MLGIDKDVNEAWGAYSEWAERQFKAGYIAGSAGDVAPDNTFSAVFTAGYLRGYEVSQIQDQRTIYRREL